MPVEYVRVKPLVDLFSPAIRPTGAVAIIGAATVGTEDKPELVASPSDAVTKFGKAFDTTTDPPTQSPLTRAIETAFKQSPGPTQVWGVRSGTNVETALTEVGKLEVQFVVLADTEVRNRPDQPALLARHDGVERRRGQGAHGGGDAVHR